MRYLVIVIVSVYALVTQAQVPTEVHLGISRPRLVKYSPNGDMISFAIDKKVKFYRSGIHFKSLSEKNGRITALDFDHEGQLLLVGHANGLINLWDVHEGSVKHSFAAHDSHVIGSQFLASSDRIVTADHNTLSFWDQQGQLVTTIPNYYGPSRAMAVGKNGELIALSGSNRILFIFDQHGKLLIEIQTHGHQIKSISISPDGQRIAAGCFKGDVDLWNLTTGVHISTLLKTSGPINSLEFSNDAKYVAVGSEDLYLVSVIGRPLNMVFKSRDGAIINSSFSPDGKYMAVIEDLSPFARILDISDLNIPSILRFKDDNDNIPPQIYISNPPKIVNERVNYSKDLIDIKGSVFDDYGIRTIRINDIETPIKENGRFIINMPLARGENPVKIEAVDLNGNISVKRFTVSRKSDEELYDAEVAKYYLFAVGINNYVHWSDLSNAVKDANDVSQVLLNKYVFDFENITLLKNEQATSENIMKGLRSMIEKVTPQDNLLIYFSGHGYFDELLNEGYWIPSEALASDQTQYISNSAVLKIIENINSQHTFLIADACFSGSLFTNTRGGRSNSYIDQVEKYKSRWALASGRLETVSDGEPNTNSPFARVLLGYLNENKREEFAVSELVQHVKMHVPSASGQAPIGSPLRIDDDEGGEFIFRLKQ